MNIIIDVTRMLRRLKKKQTLTGIDRVTMAYIQHYEAQARALVRWCGRSWVLTPTQSAALFVWLTTPRSNFAVMQIIIKGILFKTTQKILPGTFLINTGHISLGQSDYMRMVHKFGIKLIFFVHDLIPISYPEYSSAGEDVRYKQKMNYVLSHAHAVITNSQATLDDLTHYAHQTSQNMPKAQVALLAPGILMQAPGARPLAKPYFVILSTIEPRKNHLLLLHIWRSLFQRLGDKAPHLLVIGHRGWECENILDLLDRCQFLKSVVTEISHCSDADLITYIHHSQALLTPSFIEGYGLPLVEALALSVPVIASDIAVFREIAGDIPDYVDQLDSKRWRELIIEYAQPNSVNRAAQLMRMHRFKSPSWSAHFMKVDTLLAAL